MEKTIHWNEGDKMGRLFIKIALKPLIYTMKTEGFRSDEEIVGNLREEAFIDDEEYVRFLMLEDLKTTEDFQTYQNYISLYHNIIKQGTDLYAIIEHMRVSLCRIERYLLQLRDSEIENARMAAQGIKYADSEGRTISYIPFWRKHMAENFLIELRETVLNEHRTILQSLKDAFVNIISLDIIADFTEVDEVLKVKVDLPLDEIAAIRSLTKEILATIERSGVFEDEEPETKIISELEELFNSMQIDIEKHKPKQKNIDKAKKGLDSEKFSDGTNSYLFHILSD